MKEERLDLQERLNELCRTAKRLRYCKAPRWKAKLKRARREAGRLRALKDGGEQP